MGEVVGVCDPGGVDVIGHCWCGHSAPPHTETQCDLCPCTQLNICVCGVDPL